MNSYDTQLADSVYTVYANTWCTKCRTIPRILGGRVCIICNTPYVRIGEMYKVKVFRQWQSHNQLVWNTRNKLRCLPPTVPVVYLMALSWTLCHELNVDYVVQLYCAYSVYALPIMEFVRTMVDIADTDDDCLLESRSNLRSRENALDLWYDYNGCYRTMIEWLPKEMLDDTLELII